MRTVTVLFVALLLTACTALGPEYQRPETDIPVAWRSEIPTAESRIGMEWWKLFADSVLTGLIDEALQKNRDVLLASARVDQYLAQLETTRAQFFPQAGYALGVSRQDNAIAPLSSSNPLAYTLYQGSLQVSWELDLWGRIRRASEAARATVLASEEEHRDVLLSLVSKVAASYITLLGYDRQLEIARETQQSYGETLRIFRLRHQHGTISGIELKQIESQHESAVQTVPRMQALIAQQENLLSLLLGSNPGPVPRGRQLGELGMPALPAVLPLRLLERRPDIRKAEYELMAANARIGEAKARYFPAVSLSGLLGRQSSELTELFRDGGGLWSLGGNVAGSLFSFGAISGQVEQAQVLTRQAVLRYEKTIQQAFGEVENALIGTLKQQEQLQAQRRQNDILREYARLSRLAFEGGSGSYLQVLDAERALFSGMLSGVQTQVQLMNSVIDLYRALAGAWDDDVASKPQ